MSCLIVNVDNCIDLNNYGLLLYKTIDSGRLAVFNVDSVEGLHTVPDNLITAVNRSIVSSDDCSVIVCIRRNNYNCARQSDMYLQMAVRQLIVQPLRKQGFNLTTALLLFDYVNNTNDYQSAEIHYQKDMLLRCFSVSEDDKDCIACIPDFKTDTPRNTQHDADNIAIAVERIKVPFSQAFYKEAYSLFEARRKQSESDKRDYYDAFAHTCRDMLENSGIIALKQVMRNHHPRENAESALVVLDYILRVATSVKHDSTDMTQNEITLSAQAFKDHTQVSNRRAIVEKYTALIQRQRNKMGFSPTPETGPAKRYTYIPAPECSHYNLLRDQFTKISARCTEAIRSSGLSASVDEVVEGFSDSRKKAKSEPKSSTKSAPAHRVKLQSFSDMSRAWEGVHKELNEGIERAYERAVDMADKDSAELNNNHMRSPAVTEDFDDLSRTRNDYSYTSGNLALQLTCTETLEITSAMNRVRQVVQDVDTQIRHLLNYASFWTAPSIFSYAGILMLVFLLLYVVTQSYVFETSYGLTVFACTSAVILLCLLLAIPFTWFYLRAKVRSLMQLLQTETSKYFDTVLRLAFIFEERVYAVGEMQRCHGALESLEAYETRVENYNQRNKYHTRATSRNVDAMSQVLAVMDADSNDPLPEENDSGIRNSEQSPIHNDFYFIDT